MNKHFFFVMIMTVVLASCKKDDPLPPAVPFVIEDVNTGILLDNGSEMIMLNANVGARWLGDAGSYLSWYEAVESCPEDYHLMTKAEAEALMVEFNTLAKIQDSILHMPLTGCILPPGTLLTIQEFGFYHLAEQYDDKQSWYFCFGTYNSVYAPGGKMEVIDVYYDQSKTLHPVRCVKDREVQ